MIDRALVEQIARHAIEAYLACEVVEFEAAKTASVLRTVDQFTGPEPTDDEIADEIEQINMEYLALNARQSVLHYLREGWAKERIVWRKEREANSR